MAAINSGIIIGPLLPALIAVALYLMNRVDEPLFTLINHELYQSYDYIIIGGGSAGAVLASRLSEDSSLTVLLIEAGGIESISTDVPLNAANLQLTDIDWKYVTVPQQRSCQGLNNHSSRWPRGRILGGSSVLNYLLYVRGNKYDYDNWAINLGLINWSWKHVFPYFIKSENNTNLDTVNNGFHGSGGYLTTGQSPDPTPLGEAFQNAGKFLGYDSLDYNGAIQTGFSISQATLRDGARCSTAKAFLLPAIKRENLKILTFSFVTKILINPVTKSAFGVKFDTMDTKDTIVHARREIILSAGTINSPQLLMLSGVGPRSELMRHKIKVIKHLVGVGENLQDQIYPLGIHFSLNSSVSLVMSRGGVN